eukprot:6476660-Amphidinium_carterae.1
MQLTSTSHVLLEAIWKQSLFHHQLVSTFGEKLAEHIDKELGPFATDCHDPESSEDDCDGPDGHLQKLLPCSMQILGMCHITHNAQWAVTQHMREWKSWYRKLKNTAALLSRPNLMRRVLAVLSTGPIPHCRQVFHETAPALHEERWQVMQTYMAVALPQLQVLKHTWTREMLHDARQGEKEFDSVLFEETLNDEFFFSYFRMVQQLESNLQWWTKWSEGCACHEVFRTDLEDWSPAERKQ